MHWFKWDSSCLESCRHCDSSTLKTYQRIFVVSNFLRAKVSPEWNLHRFRGNKYKDYENFFRLLILSPLYQRCRKGEVPLYDVIGWHHRLRKKWLTSRCFFLKQGKSTFSLQRALHPHKLKFNILAYFVTALVLNNQYITWIFLTFLQFDTQSSCVVREI